MAHSRTTSNPPPERHHASQSQQRAFEVHLYEAIIAILSEKKKKDELFTNQDILAALIKRGVDLRYRTQHMDVLAKLARDQLIKRVHQGLYAIPRSGEIINEFHTRKRGPKSRKPPGEMYELIATDPMLVRSPTGKIFRLIELEPEPLARPTLSPHP